MHTQQLTLGYANHDVVHDLTVDMPPGKVTAIVGPNGCGKSTLLRGVARLLTPRHGQVLLDDANLADLTRAQLARHLGLLPQGPVAPAGLTVRDLVARGRYPHRAWYQRWTAEDEQHVTAALEQVQLLERVHDPLDELSGGQRQRAWLAMVLAQDTAHLLLDEPTTYLDLAHAVDLMTLVRRIAHGQARTLVCVLHDLTLAARFADHMIIMSDGRLAASGPPADILTPQLLATVFGLDAAVLDVEGSPAVVPK